MALWIRRVLVRAEEGQLKAPHRISPVAALSLFAAHVGAE
jgi:hypothetical protein